MMELFNRGNLRDYLSDRLASSKRLLERMPEDEVLARSTDDLVAQLVKSAQIEPLAVGADAVDGGVAETQVERYDQFDHERYKVAGFRIYAVFEYVGASDLLYYVPQTFLMKRFNAEIGNGTITVQVEQVGSTPDPVSTKQAIDREIGNIRTMAEYAARDACAFNASLGGQLRPAVESRKKLLQDRRDLAGALGFPLKKRTDAPAPVPLQRKVLGLQRSKTAVPRPPYRAIRS